MTAAGRVPPEPATSAAAGDIARIRVRLPPPHEHSLERRFNAHDTLAVSTPLISWDNLQMPI